MAGSSSRAQVRRDDEEEELENLEDELQQMARRIIDFRATLPAQLKSAFSSVMLSQRPSVCSATDGSEPEPSTSQPFPETESRASKDTRIPVELGNVDLASEEEQENAKKLQLLKDKILRNASTMPTIQKRMRECISRIDKLESRKDFIHPVFKRSRTS